MADNIAITAGTGTSVATDDLSSVHHPYVKVEYGADGSATPVSTTNPLPTLGSLETSKIYAVGTALTPKFAFANVAASQTDSSLVALVASKKLRVLAAYALPGATATDLTFQSNAVAISAKFANGANGGEVLPFNPVGWFETVAGEALKVTTGAGSTTGIGVVYVEV